MTRLAVSPKEAAEMLSLDVSKSGYKALPPVDHLLLLLRYDPETGFLFWRERSATSFRKQSHCDYWNRRHADQRAFATVLPVGYLTGRINKRRYLAHRVIWKMFYGTDPVNQIDHIDQDKANNRIGNLRDVTHLENSQNKPMQPNNRSGVAGVYSPKGSDKWLARIKQSGRWKHLGTFETYEDAVSARRIAEQEIGFHPNHCKAKIS